MSLLQYEANKMQSEALKTYELIVSSRIYVINGKLQANMGNIHFDMGNYEKAVKFYKMSLDKVYQLAYTRYEPYTVAVLGKNIWGAWPLIIWGQPRLSEINRTNYWCIAKKLGGYTLETWRRAARVLNAESARIEAPRGVGFLGGGQEGVSPSPAD